MKLIFRQRLFQSDRIDEGVVQTGGEDDDSLLFRFSVPALDVLDFGDDMTVVVMMVVVVVTHLMKLVIEHQETKT
jgi:hypothetical protein